ncbi:metal ABC transporter ATP-binding protein [Streptococcus loxodontisalivarius]|uniref:Iron/zinc/copper transport system ATP-binding protein n=1 Tax=Streptococcus loxodontisalivarius TaxID=1349415 RepID=A0ABS2PUC1_9STRE|nr:metal ABC transporter ATP-binding protein [Streptococcus loxodontisalivarius]MBM7643069.1 iron/zinc/copper transport system ATP-binding protein [Streptococcus loxodontisalivarius]
MISIRNLQLSYDGKSKVLEDLNLELNHSGMIGIIGPNGAGKSSLLTAIMGLAKVQGQVEIGKNPRTKLPYQLAYVEQKSKIDYDFPIKVKECVSLGLFAKKGLFNWLNNDDWQLISQALKQVGLEEFADYPIRHLSGGQFQRMLLARCLVQEADILLLDEPFVGIDAVSEALIISLLRNEVEKGKMVLIVHHDLAKVRDYFDQLLILNHQLVAFGQTLEVFVSDYLKEAYGQELFLGSEEVS